MAGNDQQRSLTQDFIFRQKIISINHTNSHIEIKNSNEKYRLQRQMGWKIFQQPINNLLDQVRKNLEFGFKAHCIMHHASTKAILAFCLYQLATLFVLFFPQNFSQYEGRCSWYRHNKCHIIYLLFLPIEIFPIYLVYVCHSWLAQLLM